MIFKWFQSILHESPDQSLFLVIIKLPVIGQLKKDSYLASQENLPQYKHQFTFYDQFQSIVGIFVINFYLCLEQIQQMTIKYFCFIFPENQVWHFVQIVSERDNLRGMGTPVSR